jgi:hypothetical protein
LRLRPFSLLYCGKQSLYIDPHANGVQKKVGLRQDEQTVEKSMTL